MPAESARFEAAILQSRRQLLKLRSRLSVLPEESQGEIAPLLDAYLQMLGPSRLVRGARKRIQERLVSAETAVMEEANAVAAALLALADDTPPRSGRRGTAATGGRGARDRPPARAQSHAGAVPQLLRRAAGLDPAGRGAPPIRRCADRPGAHRGRGHRGGRHGRPYRNHSAGARHPLCARRARAAAGHQAGRDVLVDGATGIVDLASVADEPGVRAPRRLGLRARAAAAWAGCGGFPR